MKLLVVGSGGREHALAWRLASSPRVQLVYVAPGNGGTAREPNLKNVPIPVTDIGALADFAHDEGIAFTVVGPEAPLAAGIVDLFRQRGLEIFGPTKAAAQLESSKEFAKSFMVRHRIPTADFRSFTDAAEAHAWIDQQGAPIVVKADGLASGKGVVVATTTDEAHRAIDMMLVDARMGAAGSRVIVEEFVDGEEASFIVMCDGQNVLALASSQDHKRLLDGDRGPNTGGMGAYSPAPIVTPEVHARVMREVIHPTIAGMAADGIPYTGFLYAGLMIGADGRIRTLEFNCRMGDPETQPIVARIKSDLVDVFEHAIRGTLDKSEIDWDRRTALGVVLATAGYPDQPHTGDPIAGVDPGAIPAGADCLVFHAGTTIDAEGRLVTSGGRVMCVTALGDSIKIAQSRAYATAGTIRFAGMQYRRDIGHRGLPAHARRGG